MNKYINVKVIFVFLIFISASGMAAESRNEIEKAIEYSQLPAQQRVREATIDLLLKAEASAPDQQTKADINRRIGQLYWQKFNPASETRNEGEAIKYYEKAVSQIKGERSLLSVKLDAELGAIFVQMDNEKAISLLRNVVTYPAADLFSMEVTESFLANANALSPREVAAGIDVDSAQHKLDFEERLERMKQIIANKLLVIQKSAMRNLVIIEKKKGGIPALMKLAEDTKKADLKKIVDEAVVEDAKAL